MKLKEISRVYERNFQLLLTAVKNKDRKAQLRLLKEEDELEESCIKEQKRLHIFRQDPCKLDKPKDCTNCSGFYAVRHYQGGITKRIMVDSSNVKKDDHQIWKCYLHPDVKGFKKSRKANRSELPPKLCASTQSY